jgi:DNA-binding CsgD family transcriptional regulator
MLEIRRIERWTRMTDLESDILEWDLKGYSNGEIGEVVGMTADAVSAALCRLRQKIKTYPHRGLLTVLVETCGWEAVSEFLAEQYA